MTTLLDTPLSNVTARQQAIESLRALVQDGAVLQALSIKNNVALQTARHMKLSWTRAVLAILEPHPHLIERFNGWCGPLLSDNAQLPAFVEQFHSEMQHRVSHAHAALAYLEAQPLIPTAPPTLAPAPQPPPAPAPVTRAPAPTKPSTEVRPMQTLQSPPKPQTPAAPPAAQRGLLIVHHANEACEANLTAYAKGLGFELTPVHRAAQPDQQAPADRLPHTQSFAFALVLTASGDQPLDPRTLFELGYCAGRFGPERVCVLHPDSSAAPSKDDCDLVHIPLDPSGGWQLQIARQLKRSGLDLDLNRLF